MLILLFIVILINKDIIMSDASDNKWMDTLIRQLKIEWVTYQLVIFRNNSNVRTLERDFIFEALLAGLPIVVVDLTKINVQFPLFVSRSTTVYIILHTLLNQEYRLIEDVKDGLNFITRLAPLGIRPRCLMIFLNSLKSQKMIRSILLHAWSINYLDFSIMNINTKNVSKIFSYNPFTVTYRIQTYTSQVNIFPNKMNNMNGYKLKLPYIDTKPYIIRNNNTYSGIEYDIIKDLANHLNFEPVLLDYKSGYTAVKRAAKDLEDGHLQLLPFTLFAAHPLTFGNAKITRGIVFTFDHFSGLVPNILASRKIVLPIKILVYLFVGIFIILSTLLVTGHLRITRQMSNPFSTVQLFFGASGVSQPERTADRIMFFCVVILSLTFCGHIYAKFTDIHLTEIPLRLASFDDVVKADLIPYVSDGTYDWIFNDPQDKSLEILKSRSRKTETKKCIRYILKGKEVICFVFFSKGNMYMLRYNKNSEIRKTELEFIFNGKNFVFEQASPYVDKFNKALRQMMEAGILNYLNLQQKFRKENRLEDKNFWKNKSNNLLIIQIVTILGLGYTSAIIMFFIESIYHHLKKFSAFFNKIKSLF